MKFLLAQKKEMTQLFNEETGAMVPVTKLVSGVCVVSQIKTAEKDGYDAVQLVFNTKKSLAKPQQGHFKKLPANAFCREFRMSAEEAATVKIGDVVAITSFAKGDTVAVTGTSKGHGFQGVVKRHGFKGSLASHGHKDQLRMPGSIGATDPARVFKGTRMGGHMGDEQVTTQGLTVEKVDVENNTLYVKGAVPGALNGYIVIKADGEMTIAADKSKKEPATETNEQPKAETPVEEHKEEAPVKKETTEEESEMKKEPTSEAKAAKPRADEPQAQKVTA